MFLYKQFDPLYSSFYIPYFISHYIFLHILFFNIEISSFFVGIYQIIYKM